MDVLFNMLKFGGGWFVGNLLFSTSVTTIGCCLFCAFPILKELKPYSDYIEVRRAKRLYRNSILLHTFFLAIASWAVITFLPSMIQYGFFFSLAFTTFIGMRSWGRNTANIDDFIKVIQKYVVPGKDDEAFRAMVKVLYDHD